MESSTVAYRVNRITIGRFVRGWFGMCTVRLVDPRGGVITVHMRSRPGLRVGSVLHFDSNIRRLGYQ